MTPKRSIPVNPVPVDPESQGTFFEVANSTEYGSLGTKEIVGEPTVPGPRAQADTVSVEATEPEAPTGAYVNAELVEALNYLGRAGMHHALPKAPHRKLHETYHELEISERQNDAPANAKIFETAAQNALRRALGVPTPTEDKEQTLPEVVRETAFQRAWNRFQADYAGPENAAARRRFRAKLRKSGAALVERLVLFDPTAAMEAGPAEVTPAEQPEPVRKRTSIDLKARMSLSRALQETYFSADPAAYEDVSEEALDTANPARLGSLLMGTGVQRDAPTTLLYYRRDRNNRNRENRIAVTAAEALVLRRGLVALAKHGHNTTLASRPDKTDADQAAAYRAMEHATEPKRTTIQQYLDGKLTPQRALLDKFSDMAKWWGLSQIGGEGNMRAKLAELDTTIIDDMVEAAAGQTRLNHADAVELKRAIFKQMVRDRGDGKPDIQYTRKLLDIARQYNQHRQNIARDRLDEINEYLSRYEV